MILLADEGLGSGDLFWGLIAFFFMVIYFLILFQILFDLFRDHETSGWAKAAWILFIFVIPLVAMLVYLIVRGPSMQKRAIAAQKEAQEQFDDYVKETAGSGDAASQIEKAHALLDKGAISQEEFDALKAKALS